MSPWLFIVYRDEVMVVVKWGWEGEEKRKWRLSGLLCADDLALCGESEEDLRAILGSFEACRREDLKINACKSKVMLLN